ncbi:MAG TPA: diguanylate cyclase [Longimicrobiales bacterium]|nr:diguanylate cyclase [Longimicrobiales bacterium]
MSRPILLRPDAPNPGSRPIPIRAAPLALAALAVPGVCALLAPAWLQDDRGLLMWITPILPAFLLAYYRGWRGAALALAFAMASLALGNAALLLTGAAPPRWHLMFVLVVVYIVLTQGVAALAEALERDRRAAERMAHTDPLTGLPNRREAERVLARGFEAARRGEDLSVVLFDLDRFKRVNDDYGHAVGDEVLREMAAALRRHTRGMDLAARFGGEEFLTVLPGSSAVIASAYAERIRAALAGAGLACGVVTASAGVAHYSGALVSSELLIAAADRALYAAKEAGRDQVRVWTEPTATPGARRDEALRDQAWSVSVLVVDDDAVVERAVARALSRRGFTARPAGGAREALRRFRESVVPVDVLLTDVVMPEMSGPTLVQQLAEGGWEPRVIFMSGHTRGEVRATLFPGGRAHFVEKPLDYDLLSGLLRGSATPRTSRSIA